MKKFIILIASAFSFCLFTVLLVFAFATNDYGINIDESGLFPKFDFTFFDNDTGQTYNDHIWTDISKETTSIKIKNNTKQDIPVTINIDYQQDLDDSFSLEVNTFGSISVTKDGAIFNINTVPYNDFDYTYIDYSAFINNESTHLNVFGNENFDNGENIKFSDFKNFATEYTIKAGETYEIKLP